MKGYHIIVHMKKSHIKISICIMTLFAAENNWPFTVIMRCCIESLASNQVIRGDKFVEDGALTAKRIVLT